MKESDNPIPVFRPSLGEEELSALRVVFRSGWVGMGPKTEEFEREFAAYVGAKYAVGLNSATAALHLACLALGVGPGDEVLVPAITFVSTAHAPAYCGATPVFVDVEPDTLTISIEDMESKITPRTRAVIPVHYGGHACRMDELWDVTEKHGIAVIEDASHACGSEYMGQKIGGLGRSAVTCFSFQAVKNLPTGDGGMITTDRVDLVSVLHRLRWLGINKSTWDRTEEDIMEMERGARRYASYGWYYEVDELGYKYHMNDIAATIGLVQLQKLPQGNARRLALAGRYTEAFAQVDWLECPVEKDYTRSAWHNYVVRTPYRDELNIFLRERGVSTGVHYVPLHLQPYYRSCRQRLPVAEQVWPRLLTLPLFPSMTEEQHKHVVKSVLSFEPQTRRPA